MRSALVSRVAPIVPVLLLAASIACGGQVVSTMAHGRVSAVMETGGFMLASLGTAPESYGDLAPPQLFEIIRPGYQAITIGRMFTSCSCVQLQAASRSFGPGEQAVVSLHNVRATPPEGMHYSIYVQITRPIRTTLRFDTYMLSSQFAPAPVVEVAQPEAGITVSDGGIEVIVPVAEPKTEAPAKAEDVPSPDTESGVSPESADDGKIGEKAGESVIVDGEEAAEKIGDAAAEPVQSTTGEDTAEDGGDVENAGDADAEPVPPATGSPGSAGGAEEGGAA